MVVLVLVEVRAKFKQTASLSAHIVKLYDRCLDESLVGWRLSTSAQTNCECGWPVSQLPSS